MHPMAVDDHRRLRAAALDVLAIVALSGVAFYLTFQAGRRGLYPFDQSILFDGSYRVLSGQVPYRDFVMPFGPVAFWLHAVFFRIMGVTYLSYIVGACVIDVLAALLSVAVIRLLFPSMRLVSYAGGLLTAVWFYPPFGTPWVDQTAFFFSLAALAGVVAAITRQPRRPWKGDLLLGLCGLFAVASFLSKQNVGVFMLPLYPLLLVSAGIYDRAIRLRGLAAFAAGLAASAAGFAVWLWLRSDPATFAHYFFGVASHLGRERLAGFIRSWFGLLRPFFGGRGVTVVNVMMLCSLAVALVALVRTIRRARGGGMAPHRRRVFLASVICVYAILFQHAFINTTLNQPENALAFAGTSFALAVGILLGMAGVGPSVDTPGWSAGRTRSARLVRLSVGVITAIAVVLASKAGVEVAMSRKVHDIFRGSEFPRPIAVAPLRPLRWAEPTQMGGFEIPEESVVRLYRYLRQRKQNFFVFPDFTFLYGLLGVPSPQPVLWFHDGVTYSRGANSDLDRWIVDDLERNNVTLFVLEQVSWFNTGQRWGDFPAMRAYVRSNFTRVDQIGPFSVYEKVRAGG
jgi:hypothetical protein